MTTITVVCPPTSSMAFLESGSDLDTGLVPVTLPTIDSINRTRSTKKPRNLKGRFRGLGVCLESREGSGRHAVLSPETCYGPGKRPGPPPAAVEGQTMKSRRRVTRHRRPLLHRAIRCKKLTRDQSDRTRNLEETGPVEPNRKVMVKDAAARRATRRLPLGEPPLVITTHAITSFRSSHPDPRETSLARFRALVRRATVARPESRPSVCLARNDRNTLASQSRGINRLARRSPERAECRAVRPASLGDSLDRHSLPER